MQTGRFWESQVYNIKEQSAKKTVFNFIVTILETALKYSPTVTRTKAGEQCDKKINNFGEEIWSMVYSPYLADGEEIDLDN